MRVDVKYILFAATLSMGLFTSCTSSEEECKLPQSCHGLNMTELPQRWDEAIPLGNGLTGGLQMVRLLRLLSMLIRYVIELVWLS